MSCPVAVGQDKDSLSSVRSAGVVARSETIPFRIEPERGKITEDSVEAPNNEG